MRSLIVIILSVTLFGACARKTKPVYAGNGDPRVSGVLRNYTGLDGCGWIIELDKPDAEGNTKLEPVNLGSFNLTLKEGQRILFGYTLQRSVASVCMAGAIAELQNAVDEN